MKEVNRSLSLLSRGAMKQLQGNDRQHFLKLFYLSKKTVEKKGKVRKKKMAKFLYNIHIYFRVLRGLFLNIKKKSKMKAI